MFRMTPHELSRRALLGLLPCLFGGLVLAGSAHAHSPSATSAAAPKAYRVINLRPGILTGYSSFNARDQIALSLQDGSAFRAYFYDGSSLRDIGTLGGTRAFAFGLNNAGEVAGYASLAGDATFHAFKWSRQAGMRDLGTLDGSGTSISGSMEPINNRGQVVGASTTQAGPSHAFLWSPGEGMRDLGALPGGPGNSIAEAINDAGMVVGNSQATPIEQHAFLWTRRSGMIDLGSLAGEGSFVRGISQDGLVVGNSPAADLLSHIFTWTRRDGMRDAGTDGGIAAFIPPKGVSPNGTAAGIIRFADATQHAGLWTRSGGLRDLGTLGGPNSSASGVNDRAQVVGAADRSASDSVGFIWTARDGMVDLNARLRNAPPDLRILRGITISRNGVILAESNAGLVLLKPHCACAGPHTVGPIQAADVVAVGAPVDASLGFADDGGAAGKAGYHVLWSWGDGSGEQQGNVRHNKGSGTAGASHRYAAPGIYTVSAKVGERSGQGPTVSRTIVVHDPGAGTAGGSGWFVSPAGVNKIDQNQSGRAAFVFFAPGSTRAAATLRFQASALNFHSERMARVAAQGGKQQFEGSGTVNGRGDYRFRLGVTAGPGQAQRFGLKIWHVDAASGAEVVDYDNQGVDGGSMVPAMQGTIVLR